MTDGLYNAIQAHPSILKEFDFPNPLTEKDKTAIQKGIISTSDEMVKKIEKFIGQFQNILKVNQEAVFSCYFPYLTGTVFKAEIILKVHEVPIEANSKREDLEIMRFWKRYVLNSQSSKRIGARYTHQLNLPGKFWAKVDGNMVLSPCRLSAFIDLIFPQDTAVPGHRKTPSGLYENMIMMSPKGHSFQVFNYKDHELLSEDKRRSLDISKKVESCLRAIINRLGAIPLADNGPHEFSQSSVHIAKERAVGHSRSTTPEFNPPTLIGNILAEPMDDGKRRDSIDSDTMEVNKKKPIKISRKRNKIPHRRPGSTAKEYSLTREGSNHVPTPTSTSKGGSQHNRIPTPTPPPPSGSAPPSQPTSPRGPISKQRTQRDPSEEVMCCC